MSSQRKFVVGVAVVALGWVLLLGAPPGRAQTITLGGTDVLSLTGTDLSSYGLSTAPVTFDATVDAGPDPGVSADDIIVQPATNTTSGTFNYSTSTTTQAWTNTSDWLNGNVPGETATGGDTATFSTTAVSGSQTFTVDVDENVTLGTLTLSPTHRLSTTGSYTIAASSGGGFTFNSGSTSASATVNNTAGSNTISTPVTLASNLYANVSASSTLTISGIIGGSSYSITDSGAGLLVLSNANTYGGGTTVDSGGSLQLGNAGGLGATTGTLAVNGVLNLHGYSPTVAWLSERLRRHGD